ncbi:MAG: MraY family glycosyltransferase [Patescibacteria group bacterium]
MMYLLLFWGIIAFALSFILSGLLRKTANRFCIIDKPEVSENKIHKKPTPLLGGNAIFFSIAIIVIVLIITSNVLTGGEIMPVHYMGFLVGGVVLMIGGYLDDRYRLPPKITIVAPVLAALCAILFGIEIEKLTNPFGGVIFLGSWQSDILVFVWLMVVMYTTKFLDGLDGLATGVSTIGATMIMLLALTVAYFQPDVALLSAVSIGALIGFLFWNIHPAKLFLGEGGSTFVGYLLGVLAVISGGKLATALLVLGIPILDVVWIVVRRLSNGGVKQMIHGDRKHLHHRLYDIGWSQKRIVLVYVIVASVFGATALFLQSKEKMIALIILVVVMVITASVVVSHEKRNYES